MNLSRLTELKLFLQNLTQEPGVYQMLNIEGQVLYVGKAINLKQRVSSYFNNKVLSPKTKALVSQITQINVSVTRSETEALLLESSLIKSLRPKYNVLMRDDKSYPFIHIDRQHDFPKISAKRCKKKPDSGNFFGPYPSALAVREMMNTLQKAFKIRNCTDNYFNARSRPCLQYQIKRCSAPCTNLISKQDYQQSLDDAILFLQGKSQQVMDDLTTRMQIAADSQAFEEAADLRDRIKQLRLIQESQGLVQIDGDLDVIVIDARPGFACIQCVRVRNGDILTCDKFFPAVPQNSLFEDDAPIWQSVFEAFIAYYYIDTPNRIPSFILTDHVVLNASSLESMLSALRGKSCKIKTGARGLRARWLDFALNNLRLSIEQHNSSSAIMSKRFLDLANYLKLPNGIARMECFDISHTQGESTVASCVVFDELGPRKQDYRLFNIQNITPGDDYAAMEQVITRRYKRLLNAGALPDVVIIDGGKGQVAVARRVFASLNIDSIVLVGVAKGPTRKSGWETLILSDGSEEHSLPSDSDAFHLLQNIRDESHRFAITAHRKKRQKVSLDSSLESLPGIGPKRRRALLQRFGGLREISNASIEELTKVIGISEDLAKRIYQEFH